MIRWIRTHPCTSALPFMFAATAAVIRVLSGRPLLECVGCAAIAWGLAFFNVWSKRRS